MGSTHDVEGMRRMARKLDDMAARLDGLEESMPDEVDAGVYAPLVADQVNEVVANVTVLILRLDKAAQMLRRTADEKEMAEHDNVVTAEEIPTRHGRIRPE